MIRRINFVLPQETKKNLTKQVIDKFYLLHSDPVKEYLKITRKYNKENKEKFLEKFNKDKKSF